jgi:hypothetical protein
MMLFDPKVGLSVKGRNVIGRQGGGREIISATVKQRQTGIGECYLGQDQKRVISTQRLKQPVK